MSLRRKGLVLAMEMDGEEEEVMVDGTEAMEEMESATDEAEEHATDVEELGDAVEDTVEDSDTLERIKDTMEGSLEDGDGLSESAAEIAEVAVESICARLGINHSNVMPAMESFGSTSSRATATRIAIESIGEAISKAWKAIVAAIVNSWDYIKKLVTGLFKAADALDGYNKKLLERADKLTGEVDKAELEKTSLAKYLSVDGKAGLDTVSTLLERSSSFMSLSGNVSKSSETLAAELAVKNIAEFDPKKQVSGLDKVFDKLLNTVESSIKGTDETTETGTVTTRIVKLKPLSGTMTYSIKVVSDSDNGSVAISLDNESVDSKVEKIAALSKDDIQKLLGLTATSIKQLMADKDTQKKYEKVGKTLKDASTSILKSTEKAEDGSNTKKAYASLRKSVTSLNTFSTKVAAKAPSQCIKTIKYAQSYATASMGNMKAAS